MYYNIVDQSGADTLITQAGDTLVTTDHVSYGGARVFATPNVYNSVPWIIVNGSVTWFVQYYKNGVRQLPPTGGGVVTGYPKDMVVWTPSDFYLTTQAGDYLVTQAGDKIETQLFYPMGAGFVTGFGILGVVATAGYTYGGVVTKIVRGITTPIWANWIITSHIGSMNFTHDETGEVVKMVMPWYNWVYAMKKLGNSGVVVYGENGVVLITPKGTAWGTRNISQIGIKGKLSVCTSQDDREHYFIDEQGFWWHIVEGQPADRIDFTNYFSAMDDGTVLTWDYKNDIIYICDGTDGYVWTKDGLGQGPADISGLGIRWGEDLIVVGPSSIAPTPFNICTDIMDFGSRFDKTVDKVELGVSLSGDAYAALDYRWGNKDSFVTSPWVKLDRYGQAPFMISGVEFKLRLKLLTYEDIQLDYANVRVLYDDLKPIGMGGE